MKKILLSFFVTLGVLVSWQAMGQETCGRVSLIGEFNGWAGDHMMDRNLDNPDQFTTILTLTEADDADTNGVIELKFRANQDWTVNWGDSTFPSGVAVQDGPNIPALVGTYLVSFNCSTGEYNFQTTCGPISLIGEFNGWSDDAFMDRDPADPNKWSTIIALTNDTDTNGIVELKFRENADWTVNWGDSTFPSGFAFQDGPNIQAPIGTYKVDFDCSTGEFNFTKTCGEIGLIGEFNGWSSDYWMKRDNDNPDMWHVILTLDNSTADADSNGIVELKFRQDADWSVNWGDSTFPSGVAFQDGPNIQAPLDTIGLTTDYYVTFNCATGEFSFGATSGSISMIGAFNDWNGDVPMNRDPNNYNLWKLTRSWFEDSEVKFRENNDWSVNWGNSDWPSGTGLDNGPNIPLVAGTYDVTFNYDTKTYNFVPNNEVCSEILIYAFFDPENPTAVNMLRDPDHPSQFSLTYNFTSSTTMFFKMDDGQTITPDDIWGGTFPCGTGVHDVTKLISVPGGKYDITFNCQSGDFCFTRLGNAVIAPKVFAINVDGKLDDSDWNIDQNVSQIVQGAVADGGDLNTVNFGVTYNETYLYVGINVLDQFMTAGEEGHVFIDGNKSGGAYDDSDLHLKFSAAGVEVIHGPADIQVDMGFQITGTGYSAEVAIPWAALGITATEGSQIGFDIIMGDDDTGEGVDYYMAWNGNMDDMENTSAFGDLIMGTLSCGCISVYNETIGDVILRNPTDMPTTYVGTYNLDNAYDLVFRKDEQGTVTWGADAWPTGTATLNGPVVPGEQGKYRVTFDCVTGDYNFDAASVVPDEGIALSTYTTSTPTIDGNLSEYDLKYNSDIMAVGTGPNNNTVTWGSLWDGQNMYIGIKVIDGVVEATNAGSPWENDAIEFYIDGNNDKDGAYDPDFDTQLIKDVQADTGIWVKADGVPVPDVETMMTLTDNGYNIELRLGWDNFSFAPGRGRVIGWSLSNNDSDNGTGRDYQTTWYGTGSNWSNTGDLGDLQLDGGPYFFANSIDEHVLYNANLLLYPNPANSQVTLRAIDNVFGNQVTVFVTDITGRIIMKSEKTLNGAGSEIQLNTSHLTNGIYFVNVLGQDGKRAVKKLIIQ